MTGRARATAGRRSPLSLPSLPPPARLEAPGLPARSRPSSTWVTAPAMVAEAPVVWPLTAPPGPPAPPPGPARRTAEGADEQAGREGEPAAGGGAPVPAQLDLAPARQGHAEGA